MASSATMEVMARQLPPEFTDLATTVRKGQQFAVNVVGAVIDWMPPAQSRGTDMQMTFTIRDNSTLTNGLRIKYFKKNPHEFPDIRNVGDVIILRELKISVYRSETMGLSSHQTAHIVFPVESIVAPAFRHQYAVQRNYLKHTKSSGAAEPDIHEQQWVISLNEHFKGSSGHMPPLALNQAAPERSAPIRSTVAEQHFSPTSAQAPSRREKFSLIKNVHGGDRDGGSRLGNFYDLAGEVVKLFFNISLGILDLYVTDYTVNNLLPDQSPNAFEQGGLHSHNVPSGKMTLHVELYPPHATWTHQNIKEGDLVFLQNVRIKWNRQGLGMEVEGNIWADKLYGDRVNVAHLSRSHPQYQEIQNRKTSYLANVVSKDSKAARRKKNKANKKSKRRKLANGNSVNDASPDQSDEGNDSDAEDNNEIGPDADGKSVDGPRDGQPPINKKLNPNVKCLHPDVLLTPLNDIINNPNRWITTSTGEKYEVPFINEKHRACLRVRDYFPHDLKDFSHAVSRGHNPDRVVWEWRFWLVLEAGEGDGADAAAINVEVRDEDAEDLLQLAACDLHRNPQRCAELEQTLFLLWGELAEQKAKFLHSHPNIKPDVSFAAVKYNIQTENCAFDTCIAEYGKLMSGDSGGQADNAEKEWLRAFKMFGTKIKH